MVAVVYVGCVVNLVALVYLMCIDIPTSAAVSARDSEHSRRRVRLRRYHLPYHNHFSICFVPVNLSHSIQTSMIASESRVQIASRPQHSHGKVWSLANWANNNRPSTSTCSPLTSWVAFFTISVWFIVVLGLVVIQSFDSSLKGNLQKIFMQLDDWASSTLATYVV